VSAAASRRSILVGGGTQPVKKSAAAVQRGMGGQNSFSKISENNFVLSSQFSDDLF